MKIHLHKRVLIIIALATSSFVALSADPVSLDCDPAKNCKPIDPCDLNPNREGCTGYQEPPIHTTPPPPPPQSDPCDYCVCVSGTTPHAGCSQCCP